MIGMEALYSYMLKHNAMPMDNILYLSLQGIGIISCIFYSFFLGMEYSDGTIRNKLIVGHKRSSIYLASFITGGLAITILFFAGVLTGVVMGLLFYTAPYNSISSIVVAGLIGWFASISYISIFNFVGMLSSSKAKTSIICILLAFTFVFSAMICYIFFSNTGNEIYQFLFDFNPVGQTVQSMSIKILSPWTFVAYACTLSAVLMVAGIYCFNKKDLK